MRRSIPDIRLGKVIRVRQEWRRREDGSVWLVAQVHRYDADAVMQRDNERILVRFEHLRKEWDRLVAAEVEA